MVGIPSWFQYPLTIKPQIMKNIQKLAVAIALISMFASCQTNPDAEELLSNPETRQEVMTTITNSNEMMKEMADAILNNNNAKMGMQKNDKMIVIMLENRDTMVKVMKENPIMMQNMMSDMMVAAQGDSVMTAGMCKIVMGNQPMMDMMQKMKN